MEKLISGSFESSKDITRGKITSSKKRSDWHNQVIQTYNKFTQKLIKRKIK
jgi:hypothetical protein